MLVLSRKRLEQIVIGDSIRLTVVKLERGTVRLGVEAPRDVRIVRQELLADFQESSAYAIQDTQAVATTGPR